MEYIIKRDGTKQEFNVEKIENAIKAAFIAVDGHVDSVSEVIATSIAHAIASKGGLMTVEEIQDLVEDLLMSSNRKDVARAYVRYRFTHEILRKENTTDKTLMELIRGDSDYWNNENANKNAKIVTTQRDYFAGITSTDFTRRFLLDKEIVDAHDNAVIHFHDCDYFAQNALHNCELCNLEDMLQNGTVVNGVMIEKPHRLITAATIATQIILAVASSSYGGCTITLTHLAPFVRDSYNIHLSKYRKEGLEEKLCVRLAKMDTKKEIEDSVQTFNYQVNSMTSTNGQTPFLSVAMYLGETDEYKEELSALIEEFFRQRMQGFKNEKGVWITPAFPKLLYVLEEDNITPDSKYWYLTKIAAECTAKRMVPDYISEKIMRKLKINRFGVGDVYPCMGCVSGDATVCIEGMGIISFENLWLEMCKRIQPLRQVSGIIDNLYLNERQLGGMRVYDSRAGFVSVKKLIRNLSSKWVIVTFDDDVQIKCTSDHPWPTNRGRIEAEALNIGDAVGEHIVSELSSHVGKAYSYDFETESDHFDVCGIYTHNCRSFLTPWRTSGNISRALNYVEGKGKYYGRFNQGVVTLNLPDIALSSNGDETEFWKIFDSRLELCHRALQLRTKRLAAGVSDMAPILWQYGALARLDKKESIKPLLYDGYSTISLGYAGLYECVKVMKGVSHTNPIGEEFGMRVMKHMNEACAKWKSAENIDYSVYGTPIESATYKFAKGLKKRFGSDVFIKMDGKDRNYITNSYHIPVFEEIDPFDKLEFEGKFQALSPGGAISYIECASLVHNTDAVLEVIRFIYDHIMYAELNIKSDYCQRCGFEGEIKIIDEDGILDWECPQCKNRDHGTMNIARRTCGYIGANYFNQGRTDEIRNRYVHLDDKRISTL